MPYCAKCGAELPPNATFCAKCGAPVSAATAQTAPPGPPYGYNYGYEKREKREKQTQRNEKDHEKREKSGGHTGPLVGGGILILLGIIFYSTLTTPPLIQPSQFWAYFLFGIGIILIAQSVYLFASTHHRTAAMGPLWGGIILIAIGAAGISGTSASFWPIILIAIGVVVIIAGISARSRAPKP